MKESEIITNYFLSHKLNRETILSIGDDAAIIDVPDGFQLVTSMDTLVSNIHFFEDQAAEDIAHKALAVNLSDMAAMAALPKSYLLSLTMPAVSEPWIKSFSKGLFTLAEEFKVDLIGGDLSKGPLSISITVFGLVKKGMAIQRSNAKPGDRIYVSGHLGDAGLALELLNAEKNAEPIQDKLFKPRPRIELSKKLMGIANSMIDLSDGLILDLQRIIHSSGVGANVWLEALPLSPELKGLTDEQNAINHALASGDDYELCFTVPKNKIDAVAPLNGKDGLAITCIGEIVEGEQITLLDKLGREHNTVYSGHEHFL